MELFATMKFLHVLSAAIWVGAGIGLSIFGLRMRVDGDREGFMALSRQGEALGKMIFGPAALATLVFGVAMVATEARFSFTDLWIMIGFIGIAASFVVGAGLAAGTDKKLNETIRDFGIDHPDVDVLMAKTLKLSLIDVGILVVVIWAMVAKPML